MLICLFRDRDRHGEFGVLSRRVIDGNVAAEGFDDGIDAVQAVARRVLLGAEPLVEKVFGDHAYNISLNSTKSMTGHLLGGTGAVEAIATIMALHKGIIPPTINHFEDDPQIDPKLDFTFNTARKRDIRYALSNAFGFGGQNTSLLFKKYTL